MYSGSLRLKIPRSSNRFNLEQRVSVLLAQDSGMQFLPSFELEESNAFAYIDTSNRGSGKGRQSLARL